MVFEYIHLIFFSLVCIIIGLILFSLSFFFVFKTFDVEKLEAYECGFSPFDDSRNRFDVCFYLVGIIFIIFDLEIVFLFPWVISLDYIGYEGYWTMFIFLVILLLGFFYEWAQGVLDW